MFSSSDDLQGGCEKKSVLSAIKAFSIPSYSSIFL
jgi:hypothetical protein